MNAPRGPAIVAIYAHLDEMLAGVRILRREGYTQLEVMSPVPHHEIQDLVGAKPSPVRMFTLAGGLLGLAIGWAITIGPLSNFNLHVGGKPIQSIPPFGVVAYICTILFGALATVAGMIVNTRVPQYALLKNHDPRLSSDHFGVRVYCEGEHAAACSALLHGTGAIDVIQDTP